MIDPDDTDMTIEEFDALLEQGVPVTIVNERPHWTFRGTRASGGTTESSNRPVAAGKVGPVRFAPSSRRADVNG